MILNTELGLLIESPELVRSLKTSFQELIQPDNAWRIYLDEDDRMTWQSADETRHTTPAKNFRQRLRHNFFKLLPVSNQL